VGERACVCGGGEEGSEGLTKPVGERLEIEFHADRGAQREGVLWVCVPGRAIHVCVGLDADLNPGKG
jgi:hypothetical protein